MGKIIILNIKSLEIGRLNNLLKISLTSRSYSSINLICFNETK